MSERRFNPGACVISIAATGAAAAWAIATGASATEMVVAQFAAGGAALLAVIGWHWAPAGWTWARAAWVSAETDRLEALNARLRRDNLIAFRELVAEHGIDTADLTDERLADALHEVRGMHLDGVDHSVAVGHVLAGLRADAERAGGRG